MKKEMETIKNNIIPVKNIQNSFFDVVIFVLSFLLSFVRSFWYFLQYPVLKRRNYFFDFFDFGFRIWPKYFWKNPSFYKLTSFFWNLVASIFSDKK
jgi:hypothetical protein